MDLSQASGWGSGNGPQLTPIKQRNHSDPKRIAREMPGRRRCLIRSRMCFIARRPMPRYLNNFAAGARWVHIVPVRRADGQRTLGPLLKGILGHSRDAVNSSVDRNRGIQFSDSSSTPTERPLISSRAASLSHRRHRGMVRTAVPA